jgi:hypothetical protein
MEKMTVSAALKRKNQLTAEIKKLYEIVKSYNSIELGNIRRYGILDTLQRIDMLTEDLVDLKTKLHRANGKVYHKIFTLAELKGKVKQLKALPVDEGKVPASSYRLSNSVDVKEVEINIVDRDDMVRQLEARIQNIQDELDTHNARTRI